MARSRRISPVSLAFNLTLLVTILFTFSTFQAASASLLPGGDNQPVQQILQHLPEQLKNNHNPPSRKEGGNVHDDTGAAAFFRPAATEAPFQVGGGPEPAVVPVRKIEGSSAGVMEGSDVGVVLGVVAAFMGLFVAGLV